MLIIESVAEAYLNIGRWVADCPRSECNSAVALEPKQAVFICSGKGGCMHVAEVRWPADVDRIVAAVAGRHVDNRNWAPAGHRQTFISLSRDGTVTAVAYPDGETVADLRDEQGGQ